VALICRGLRLRWKRSVPVGLLTPLLLSSYMLFFFRDPPRTAPTDPDLVVSGADGVIAGIQTVEESRYLKGKAVRISIFLSLFDVHVNRAPISGMSTFLGYFPGEHFFTFEEKSSDHNQHNAILIEGEGTRCLVYQIVGPVCRRVVYWPDHDAPVSVMKGDPIGMMKFGSRLDMYFPEGDIEPVVSVGDKVRAGETVVAKLRSREVAK
ncbi:MAG: phosphatidylserine decarboxylase, partial [Candidatus Pacebacteria bacterium]|nr:phosphatidylserine decarboxylase [Candidatus Paceibacterota bacterium]